MKAAIYTAFGGNDISFEKAVPMISDVGFEVISMGASPAHSEYDTPAGRRAIRKLLDRYCLEIESFHAPFPEGDRLFSIDESERLESERQCRIALDAAAELNGKVVVIHLIQPYGIPMGEVRDRMIEQGRLSVDALGGYAASLGVKLALENGQRPDYDEVLENFLHEFDSPFVGFCYDSGHENVQGTCFRLLEKYAARLFTVHIHDNSGSDIHVLPYEGNIDWNKFRRIFHSINYSGNLMLETGMANSRFKDAAEFLVEAKKRADRLIKAV